MAVYSRHFEVDNETVWQTATVDLHQDYVDLQKVLTHELPDELNPEMP